jgi:hypothetical protein
MGTTRHDLGTARRIGRAGRLWVAILAAALAACATSGAPRDPSGARAGESLGGGLLGPQRTDAYGPGVHADGTGRPFEWRTRDGQVERGAVRRNAYGLGVGMDASGRPVVATPR